MVSELCVAIKDDEKTLRKKFLIYEDYQVNELDPMITKCINETLENFDGEPASVKITITMEMQ